MPDQKDKVFLDVKTPSETFTLQSFRGIERLSSLFEYTLFMTSTSRTVNFSSLMGKSATVSLKVGSETRTYNGIVGCFEQDDTPFKPLNSQTNYKAILYPKLWLLTFSGQCRIFQNKSALEIITHILSEHQIPHSNQVTRSGKASLDFCVQYNETDFNFISRLMEREGIFYFFQQTHDNHTLVLADASAAHHPCSHAASVSFHDSAVSDQFMLHVSSCCITQRIVPKSNTLKSYNYLMPQTQLKALATGNSTAGGGNLTDYEEIYAQQSRGDSLSKVKLQAAERSQKMVEGLSTVPFFLAGYKFHLKDHPREDANLEYVLMEVIHEARRAPEGEGQHLYENSYRAFPATVLFKAPLITPRPYIYGTQTAKVTGKKGEEIYTEEYGRIKVKFHWDPSEKNDDSTSCWIRVATLWAGQTWGTLFTPRVGQEVVVSFIDGDPDKPLVVGSVYNGDHKPPYLPGHPTKSTIKTQTSKKGEESNAGYNELRFEDKKGVEEIYLHAQKDFKLLVQNNQEITVVGGNRTITLQSQQEHLEKRSGEKSNDSLTLKNGNKSLQIDKGNYSIKLMDGNITVTCSKGNVSFDVDGNMSVKCTGTFNVDAAKGVNIKTAAALSADVGGATSLKAGADTSIVAGAALTLTSGAEASITAGAALAMTAGEAASITAGAALAMTAGEAVSITAGDAIAITAAANTSVTAGTAVEVTAGANVAVTAGAATEVTAGANVAVTAGAALELTAAATITETAATVELMGLVTIDGQIPMVL